jgi:hypothetical protein
MCQNRFYKVREIRAARKQLNRNLAELNLKKELKIWDVVDVQQAEGAAQRAQVCRVDAKTTVRVEQVVATN